MRDGSISSEEDQHEYTVADAKREIASRIFSSAFTAPELINATRCVASPACDNWSLAIMAIYMVTGITPWKSASVENSKYTAYIHSDRKRSPLSPILKRKLIRSKSLNVTSSSSITSVIGSFRKRYLHDRPITPAFESKMIEVLHPNANMRCCRCRIVRNSPLKISQLTSSLHCRKSLAHCSNSQLGRIVR